jgi:hypothetical protein
MEVRSCRPEVVGFSLVLSFPEAELRSSWRPTVRVPAEGLFNCPIVPPGTCGGQNWLSGFPGIAHEFANVPTGPHFGMEELFTHQERQCLDGALKGSNTRKITWRVRFPASGSGPILVPRLSPIATPLVNASHRLAYSGCPRATRSPRPESFPDAFFHTSDRLTYAL